jgi:hypothetical protein
MASTNLRVEDILDGASNFLYLKTRFTLALKEYDLWELVDKVVVPPTDLLDLASHEKKDIKVEWVNLDLLNLSLTQHPTISSK